MQSINAEASAKRNVSIAWLSHGPNSVGVMCGPNDNDDAHAEGFEIGGSRNSKISMVWLRLTGMVIFSVELVSMSRL